MQQTSSSILLSCNIFHISSAFYWARKHWATPNGVNRFDFSIFSSLPLDWMTWLGWLSVLIFFFPVAKYELHKNNTFKLFIFIPLFFLVKLEGYFFFPNVDLKQRNWWKDPHHAQNYFTEKRAETRVIIVLVVRCRHSNHINIEVLLSLNYFYQTICVLYIEKKWALFVKQFISAQ